MAPQLCACEWRCGAGGNARAVAAARAAGTALLGGVLRAAEPPMVPQEVSRRDVLLGFEDERLEVQYRRMKALQCRSIDRAGAGEGT